MRDHYTAMNRPNARLHSGFVPWRGATLIIVADGHIVGAATFDDYHRRWVASDTPDWYVSEAAYRKLFAAGVFSNA